MKKDVLFWFCIGLFAIFTIAGRHYNPSIKTDGGSFLWTLTGAGTADTSQPFLTAPTMSITFWGADSLGQDSLAVRLLYQVKGIYGYVAVDSHSFDQDSLEDTSWLLTDKAIPVNSSARIIAKGLPGNSVVPPVIFKIRLEGWK